MAAHDRNLGSIPKSSSRSKRFISIYIALGLILCLQFFQFRGRQKDMMSYMKEQYANVLAVNASNSLRASHAIHVEPQVGSVQAAPNTTSEAMPLSQDESVPAEGNEIVDTSEAGSVQEAPDTSQGAAADDSPVQTPPKSAISAHESYIELKKIIDGCGGDHPERPEYWTYYFECNDERLLPSDMDYMLKQGKSRSNTIPKMRFTGTDIGFAGQTIDFLVAELFFMHPTPQYKGRYLEIGGYFGLEFSNSLFFEQYLGWDGWLFEPTTCYDEMVQNRPKATNLKLGLCKDPVESMSFGGFGVDRCSASTAPCKPLTSIEGWEEGFDFASVDVEGAEMFVLEAMELSKVKVKVLAIEWRTENADEREQYLKQFGYEKVVRFQWPGWGNADEIYYRPDLISAHVFDSSALVATSGSIPLSQEESAPAAGNEIDIEEADDDSDDNDDDDDDYDDDYIDINHLVWETDGDMRGNAVIGLLPEKTCRVVENICRKTEGSYWFYFQQNQDTGFEPKYKIPRPKQPIISYEKGQRTKINMDKFSLHQNSTWIKNQHCLISPVENHVVLNGDHIHMMGEYIQRVILPLHQILENYALHTKNKGRSDNSKEIQFYLNFYQNENQKVLPSHHLYMNGLQYGQDLQSWSETFDPVIKESAPPCQCYSRLAFCGFSATSTNIDVEIDGSSRNVTRMELSPASNVPHNITKHCAHYLASVESLTNDDCRVWQDLRTSLIQTYHDTNPNLSQDIHAYRVHLIKRAASNINTAPDFTEHPLKEWKIIGLSQRKGRRMWLNINETLTHCNTHYFEKQLVCVEVDVEDLPTSFVSVGSNQPLTAMDEQLVLYQSINGLIGIHGSQLTQGILMPPESVMVELFQWIPQHWGFIVWGDGWTNQKNHPTPMGIMWHNTDIHEAGWYLPRESVPLCHNVSDVELHNFTLTPDPHSLAFQKDTKQGGNATKLEYCLQVVNGESFRWDYRNFNVGLEFFEKFVDTFFPSRSKQTPAAEGSEVLACDEWREKGEGNGFVMYNLICRGENGTIRPHHYYHATR